jgi:hypothetical protein
MCGWVTKISVHLSSCLHMIVHRVVLIFFIFINLLHTHTHNNLNASMWDFKFSRRRVWCTELSSGLYCRVKLLSTDGSEVRTASSLMMEAVRTSEKSGDNHFTWQYNPEDSSEHHCGTALLFTVHIHDHNTFYLRNKVSWFDQFHVLELFSLLFLLSVTDCWRTLFVINEK